MAYLIHLTTGRRVVLRDHHVIGRSRRADLQLEDHRISSEHASIRWTPSGWQLMDMGSRNGTFHGADRDERRIAAGERVALAVGDFLGFGGGDDTWRFDNGDPPAATAEPVVGGALVEASDQMLVLPDASNPRVCIFRDANHRWVHERDGQCTPVTDGDDIEVAGARWRLHLPEAIIMTADAQLNVFDVHGMRLSFSVSGDEEHVHMRAWCRDRELDLKSYAHHYLLLTLARIRQREAADPELPSTAHGWVHIDDLASMLRVEEAKVNVHIYRARRQLAKLGVANATAIVERRSYRRQLRLGVHDIAIQIV